MCKELWTLEELVKAVGSEMVRLGYGEEQSITPYRKIWRIMQAYADETGEQYYSQLFGEKFLLEKYGIDESSGCINKDMPVWKRRQARRAVRLLSDYLNHGVIVVQTTWRGIEFKPAYKEVLQIYEDYCRKRNNKPTTIAIKLFSLKQVLLYLQNIGMDDPTTIAMTHVHEYLKTILPYSKQVVADKLGIIRDLMRMLHHNGYLQKDMSDQVPHVYNIRNNTLPAVWEKEDIEKLLRVINRSDPIGKRDYAALLMVSRLGIRNCDICNLRYSDINWRESKIELTQEKTSEPLALPFDEETGSALIDYLRNGRPKDKSDYVFLRHLRPYGPCKQFTTMLHKYIPLAGIQFERKRSHGTHSLRHAFANRLFEQSVPSETIAALLGHSSERSSGAYLRVGVESLRKCTLTIEEDASHA